MKKTIYIAGAMQGYPNFNFAAFDEAESRLRKLGWKTINPARLDREAGFDPEKDIVDQALLKEVLIRDTYGIFQSDAVALLPNWETSSGVQVELALAREFDLPVYLYPEMVEIEIEFAKRKEGK